MCSIFGIHGSRVPRDLIETCFRRTVSRGPDMSRMAEIPGGLLGFHRLAIMGLHEEGMQPFRLEDDLVVCNGELYGFRPLRARLQGRPAAETDRRAGSHRHPSPVLRGNVRRRRRLRQRAEKPRRPVRNDPPLPAGTLLDRRRIRPVRGPGLRRILHHENRGRSLSQAPEAAGGRRAEAPGRGRAGRFPAVRRAGLLPGLRHRTGDAGPADPNLRHRDGRGRHRPEIRPHGGGLYRQRSYGSHHQREGRAGSPAHGGGASRHLGHHDDPGLRRHVPGLQMDP